MRYIYPTSDGNFLTGSPKQHSSALTNSETPIATWWLTDANGWVQLLLVGTKPGWPPCKVGVWPTGDRLGVLGTADKALAGQSHAELVGLLVHSGGVHTLHTGCVCVCVCSVWGGGGGGGGGGHVYE